MATIAMKSNHSEPRLKIRINRRGWAGLVGIPVFALTIVATFIIGAMLSTAQASSQDPAGVQTVDVTVIPGDSLWELASEYAQGYETTEAVNHIIELNALDSHDIQAGDTLQIPVATK